MIGKPAASKRQTKSETADHIETIKEPEMLNITDHGPVREIQIDRAPVNALNPELVRSLTGARTRVWTTSMAPGVLDRVPDDAKGAVCVCAKCAAGAMPAPAG